MELTPELKAQFKRLEDNFQRIDTLETQIKTLTEEGVGTAELKEQVTQVSADNAAAIEAVKTEINDRQDEWETKAAGRASQSSGGLDDFAAKFTKSFGDSGLDGNRRGGRAVVEFDAGHVVHLGRKAITDVAASGGDLLTPQFVPGVIAPGVQPVTLLDIIPTLPTSATSISYVKELATTGGAGYQVAQGDRKAESDFTFERAKAEVETIAHFVKISRQMLDDAVGLRAYVESRMLYLLRYFAEGEALNGSGTDALDGINNQATAYDVTIDAGVSDLTKIDVLRMSMVQVGRSFFPATNFVLNPEDWAGIELTKDADRGYIFANPTSVAGPRMWGLPVTSTYQQGADQFTTGNFTPAAIQMWVRMAASVLISTENEDDFVKNLATLLAEMRAALTIYRPSAFVTGDFSVALTGA